MEQSNALNSRHPVVLGADIGGSHITTALIDQQCRMLVPGSFHREQVNAQGTAPEIIQAWGRVMRLSMQAAAGVQQIGIAMPGPFKYEEGISLIKGLHKYEALYELNVKDLLAQELQLPASHIKMANDAQCFLQGELYNGAAKGRLNAMGFTLGTGFGSAIAENGIVRDAAFFDTPFLASRAEEYFCARWIMQRYRELSGQTAKNVKAIADVAQTEPAVAALFHEFGANLGAFIATLQPTPELVVLGGNIAQTFPLFKTGLQEKMQAYSLSTSFVLSALGEQASLFGAAGMLPS